MLLSFNICENTITAFATCLSDKTNTNNANTKLQRLIISVESGLNAVLQHKLALHSF